MTNRNSAVKDREVLLSIQNLKKYFPIKKKSIFDKKQEYVRANESITLDIFQGETLGLVGESGCGKSTLGRTIVQLHHQTDGSTLYFGNTLAEIAPRYAKEVILSVSKQVPLFFKEEEELHKVIEQSAQIDSSKELERAEMEEKISRIRRDINNRFANMIRICGGLITASDLTKVSHVLNELYTSQVKVAELSEEVAELKTSLTDNKKKSNPEQVNLKITNKEREIVEAKKVVEANLVKVNELKDENRNNPRFDEFEAQTSLGLDLAKLTNEEMRKLRHDLQIIFQDPYSSLNPRMTVGQIIGEGIVAHGMFKSPKSPGYNEYIQDIMSQCGLAPYFIHRYPHQFSGGQRQRIGIARALALRPKFIVCDEAVSALDVSIQSQIINLLLDLKEEFNLTYLFITHDLSVVKYISDRVAVMYLGHIVELSDSDRIFSNPLHPYTQALLEAIPRTDVDGATHQLQVLEGDIPSAVRPPKGCKFNTRCKYAFEKCFSVEPELKEIEPNHFVSCHLMDLNKNETFS